MKLKPLPGFLLFMCLTLCISGLFPYAAYADDNVSITLDADTDDTLSYQPGELIPYRLTVSNLLGASWLRINITLTQSGIDREFNESCLNIQDGWIKCGNYYYYTDKAEAASDYLVVDGILLPDITFAGQDAYVCVSATADAIQYSSCVPDFDSDDPWNGTSVQDTASVSSSGDAGISSGNTDNASSSDNQADTALSSSSQGSASSSKKSSSSGGGGSSSSGSSSVTGSYSALTIYAVPVENGIVSAGTWEQTGLLLNKWKYRDQYGNYALNGWIYVSNPYGSDPEQCDWFHFDEEGIMTSGWVKASETDWYYTHDQSDGNLGRLIKGWIYDASDGRTYYSDLNVGIMLTGWQEIDGKSYYFAALSDIPAQNWFWDTALGKWIYNCLGLRSYGSLYKNELTPDGSYVDSAGVRQ